MNVKSANLRQNLLRAFVVVVLICGALALLGEPVRCFAYLRDLPDEVIVYSNDDGIAIMNFDGVGQCVIARGDFSNPVGSPDGEQVAFFLHESRGATSMRNHSELYAVNFGGTGFRRISPDSGFVSGGRAFIYPSWSRENELVYGAEQGLMIWSRVTGNRLIPNTEDGYAPVWSPDGSRIAYLTYTEPDDDSRRLIFSVFTIAPDGSDHRLITDEVTGGPFIDAPPFMWVGGNGLIAYIRLLNDDAGGDNLRILTIVNAATGEEVQTIFTGDFESRSHAFAPSGERLAIYGTDYDYRVPGETREQLLLIELRNPIDFTPLVTIQGAYPLNAISFTFRAFLNWSSDEQYVFYRDEQNERRITRVDTTTGETLALASAYEFTVWKRTSR